VKDQGPGVRKILTKKQADGAEGRRTGQRKAQHLENLSNNLLFSKDIKEGV